MKKSIALMLFWVLLWYCGASQSLQDLSVKSRCDVEIYSKENFRLFNPNTIKSRSVKSALVVQVSQPDDTGGRSTIDSCFYFTFDSDGNVITKRSFYDKRWEVRAVVSSFPERVHNYQWNSKISKVSKTGSEKIITELIFWKHTNKQDTALTITTRFDKHDRILENIVSPSKLYLSKISCHNDEPPFHYRYEYDSIGRMITDYDVISKNLIRISYPFYGELHQYFAPNSLEPFKEDIVQINRRDEIKMITTKNCNIIQTFDDIDSELVQFITVNSPTAFPVSINYQIIYFYND